MKKSKSNSESYTWGNVCKGWHLVRTETLGVIQEMMPPGSEEVLHKHTKAQQFFFILEGEATFEVEGAELKVSAGEGIHIEKGKVHKIKNETKSNLEFLVISEPHTNSDRILMKNG